MAAFTFYFSAHAGMQYGKKNGSESIHCHCIPTRVLGTGAAFVKLLPTNMPTIICVSNGDDVSYFFLIINLMKKFLNALKSAKLASK
ncbi:Hypothetical predicted protein [Mytilus galloprovincialis]|uniref:Uncharacterized protein n=1 Tax=Mytilus galloprovincialis TaxID=29158 RepID=A0A8B6HU18_MYTGA|nr:Hypothetical predicted protein [Mytilus galloprovincialis]